MRPRESSDFYSLWRRHQAHGTRAPGALAWLAEQIMQRARNFGLQVALGEIQRHSNLQRRAPLKALDERGLTEGEGVGES